MKEVNHDELFHHQLKQAVPLVKLPKINNSIVPVRNKIVCMLRHRSRIKSEIITAAVNTPAQALQHSGTSVFGNIIFNPDSYFKILT